MVAIICPRLLMIVLTAACKRKVCCNNKTRPAYSPIRFGVNTLTVTPASMAFKERPKEIGNSLLISICHFLLSIIQFMGIRSNAINKNCWPLLDWMLLAKISLMSIMFWLLATLYQIAPNKSRITAILIT